MGNNKRWGNEKLKVGVGNMKRFKPKINILPEEPICTHKFHKFSCSQAEFLHLVIRVGKVLLWGAGILCIAERLAVSLPSNH